MIYLAGEPDDMWWDGEVKEMYLGADLVWKSGPTIETYQVNMGDMTGNGVTHTLLTLDVPSGQEWHVRLQGTFRADGSIYPVKTEWPQLSIGAGGWSTGYGENAPVDITGAVTQGSGSVRVLTKRAFGRQVRFVGTVTVTKP